MADGGEVAKKGSLHRSNYLGAYASADLTASARAQGMGAGGSL